MMSSLETVNRILDSSLSLGGRGLEFDRQTPLLGALAELDSMAVVAVLTAMEDRFGVVIEDDEISAETFTTVGSLVDFIDSKLAAA